MFLYTHTHTKFKFILKDVIFAIPEQLVKAEVEHVN